ncbi:MAG TPA: DUF1674 domain-containing protein [Hyphomicrobiales bacterium]|nr:DUF1674 domain-containing protein [Hyphomicrobiales bacterium]
MVEAKSPAASKKKLTPEARRALAEAATRRAARDAAPPPPCEVAGPAGPDPARYGDWERKGIASDF